MTANYLSCLYGENWTLTDNRHIAEVQRLAIDVCDENRDSPTGNLLQEILDQTERRTWFLYEISQGGESEK